MITNDLPLAFSHNSAPLRQSPTQFHSEFSLNLLQNNGRLKNSLNGVLIRLNHSKTKLTLRGGVIAIQGHL